MKGQDELLHLVLLFLIDLFLRGYSLTVSSIEIRYASLNLLHLPYQTLPLISKKELATYLVLNLCKKFLKLETGTLVDIGDSMD